MLWFILALLGALFTSLTTITAKLGIKNVNSNFATFYRTGIVIIASAIMCLITGGFSDFKSLTWLNVLFLTLSGLCTGLSWLSYYRAMKLGSINVVAPIDKSSFIITSIFSIILFFPETTNDGNPKTITFLILSMTFMLIGTILMIDKKENQTSTNKSCVIYAIFSAIFAAFVSIFIKLGLRGINSNLATMLRTIIVFIFSGFIVLGRGEFKGVKSIGKYSWLFLTISGVFTGAAWMCEYASISIDGVSLVVVNSIGKLSILLTMGFSALILKEKFTRKSLLGLLLLTIGIVFIIIG